MRRFAWLAIVVAACGGAGPSAEASSTGLPARDAPRLMFWAVDLSAFHGDGEAVWVDESGHTLVQKATPIDGGTTNAIHRFSLDTAQLAELRSFVATFRPSSLEVVKRVGVPDEVQAHFGFRDPTGHLQKRTVWSTDWAKQPMDVRRFHEQIAAVRQHASPDNLVSSEKVADGALKLVRPGGLLVGESVP